MKKLHLEDLKVDSFVTSMGSAPRGTVAGHAETDQCFTPNVAYTCGVDCSGACTTDTGPGERTRAGVTCNVTCLKGFPSDCGTCAPAASCDYAYGCSGTSFDAQPC